MCAWLLLTLPAFALLLLLPSRLTFAPALH
jgi:hypothetical protein